MSSRPSLFGVLREVDTPRARRWTEDLPGWQVDPIKGGWMASPDEHYTTYILTRQPPGRFRLENFRCELLLEQASREEVVAKLLELHPPRTAEVSRAS